MAKEVTVILLAAGYATRLYPLTKNKPKSLLSLNSGVILDEVMRSLSGVPNLGKCILVTNHLFAGQFRAWRKASRFDVEIVDDGTKSPETRLGAICDLELARMKAKTTGDLFVIGTDNIFSWSLAEFVSRAQENLPQPSVALGVARSKEAAAQSGVVEYDKTFRITSFTEKSKDPPTLKVALCVYYFPQEMHSRFAQFIDEGGNPDAPGYFIEWLVGKDAVCGVLMPGIWYDIGTRKSYQAVVSEWRKRNSQGAGRAKPNTS